jgi:hypothetical protein
MRGNRRSSSPATEFRRWDKKQGEADPRKKGGLLLLSRQLLDLFLALFQFFHLLPFLQNPIEITEIMKIVL